MSVKQPFKVCTRCGDELEGRIEQIVGECITCYRINNPEYEKELKAIQAKETDPSAV